MLDIRRINVTGFDAAIRGMRNPMNSWDKSDSYWDDGEYVIGPKDKELAMSLSKAGRDHRKFLRMINATMDINAPLYWWKEFDTYKIGTVRNSCSTMHTIHKKPFELNDFSYSHLMYSEICYPSTVKPHIYITPKGLLELTIDHLNLYRKLYLDTNDKKWWWQMIQSLPSSYNQLSTVQISYEALSNIYHARCNHKLDEWRVFCEMIEKLPYSEIITGGKK